MLPSVDAHGENVTQIIFNTVGRGSSSNWNVAGNYVTQTGEEGPGEHNQILIIF